MANDVSIMISAQDNYSDALKKMQQTQTVFRKDLSQLDKELQAFNRNKVTLKTDLEKASKELKDAKKAFRDTGDEMSRMNLEAAQADYDNIKSNLKLVGDAAKNAERDMQSLTGATSKMQNRIGGGTAGGGGDMLASLAKSGLVNMAGQSLSNMAGAVVSSGFGSDAGDAFNSILSGAVTGAAMGSVIPGIGTAVGAAVGVATGVLTAATQKFQKVDDAFKGSVSDLFTEVQAGRAEQLASGSSIAATREMRQISFTTLLGGDEAAADKYLSEMRAFAEKTPFGEDALAEMSKTLLAYKYDVEELLPLMTAIGDAGSALGLDAQSLSDVASYLGRMQTTGKANQKYLLPLLERGIPVYDYLATALEKSNEEVQQMLEKGLIPGAKAAEIIADYMGGEFAGNMDKQSATYEGMISNLEDLQMTIDAAMGQGFNDERKKGLQEQIGYLEGVGGEKMQEANRLIGVFEASKVNEQERLMREAMDTAFAEIEADGITNEAEIGAKLQAAQAKAKIAYASSEQAKAEIAAQQGMLTEIQSAMTEDYYMAGYTLGQQLSKGVSAGFVSPPPNIAMSTGTGMISSQITGMRNAGTFGPTGAYGFQRVPYDGFPIIAHQNERLLTAGQARQMDSGGVSSPVTVTGNSFTVREDADIDRIASALAEQISIRQQGYIGGAA